MLLASAKVRYAVKESQAPSITDGALVIRGADPIVGYFNLKEEQEDQHIDGAFSAPRPKYTPSFFMKVGPADKVEADGTYRAEEVGYHWDSWSDFSMGTLSTVTLDRDLNEAVFSSGGGTWTSQVLDMNNWQRVSTSPLTRWSIHIEMGVGATYSVQARFMDTAGGSDPWTTLSADDLSYMNTTPNKRYAQFRVIVTGGSAKLRWMSFFWDREVTIMSQTNSVKIVNANTVAIQSPQAQMTVGPITLSSQTNSVKIVSNEKSAQSPQAPVVGENVAQGQMNATFEERNDAGSTEGTVTAEALGGLLKQITLDEAYGHYSGDIIDKLLVGASSHVITPGKKAAQLFFGNDYALRVTSAKMMLSSSAGSQFQASLYTLDGSDRPDTQIATTGPVSVTGGSAGVFEALFSNIALEESLRYALVLENTGANDIAWYTRTDANSNTSTNAFLTDDSGSWTFTATTEAATLRITSTPAADQQKSLVIMDIGIDVPAELPGTPSGMTASAYTINPIYLKVNNDNQIDLRPYMALQDERVSRATVRYDLALPKGVNTIKVTIPSQAKNERLVGGIDEVDGSTSYYVSQSGVLTDIASGELRWWLRPFELRPIESLLFTISLKCTTDIARPDRNLICQAIIYQTDQRDLPATAIIAETRTTDLIANTDIVRPSSSLPATTDVFREDSRDLPCTAIIFRTDLRYLLANATISTPKDLPAAATVYRIESTSLLAATTIMVTRTHDFPVETDVIRPFRDLVAKTFVSIQKDFPANASIIRPYRQLPAAVYVVQPLKLPAQTYILYRKDFGATAAILRPFAQLGATADIKHKRDLLATTMITNPKFLRCTTATIRPYSQLAMATHVFRESQKNLLSRSTVVRPSGTLPATVDIAQPFLRYLLGTTHIWRETSTDFRCEFDLERPSNALPAIAQIASRPMLLSNTDIVRPSAPLVGQATIIPVRISNLTAQTEIYRPYSSLSATAEIIEAFYSSLRATTNIVRKESMAALKAIVDITPPFFKSLPAKTFVAGMRSFLGNTDILRPYREFMATATILDRRVGSIPIDDIFVTNTDDAYVDVELITPLEVTVDDIIVVEIGDDQDEPGYPLQLLPLLDEVIVEDHDQQIDDGTLFLRKFADDNANWSAPTRLTNNLYEYEQVSNPFVGEIGEDIYIGYETNEESNSGANIHVVKTNDLSPTGEWNPVRRLEGVGGNFVNGKLVFTGDKGIYEWVPADPGNEIYEQSIDFIPTDVKDRRELKNLWEETLYQMQREGELVYPPKKWDFNPLVESLVMLVNDQDAVSYTLTFYPQPPIEDVETSPED